MDLLDDLTHSVGANRLQLAGLGCATSGLVLNLFCSSRVPFHKKGLRTSHSIRLYCYTMLGHRVIAFQFLLQLNAWGWNSNNLDLLQLDCKLQFAPSIKLSICEMDRCKRYASVCIFPTMRKKRWPENEIK